MILIKIIDKLLAIFVWSFYSLHFSPSWHEQYGVPWLPWTVVEKLPFQTKIDLFIILVAQYSVLLLVIWLLH